MSVETESAVAASNGQPPLSLGTAAARNLATTTKSVPQMQEITSRWLLRMLPWVQVVGGTYRVNRRLTYTVGRGRVSFTQSGPQIRVIPPSLREVPPFRGVEDPGILGQLAGRFAQQDFEAGEVIVQAGQPADRMFLIVRGKANKLGAGKYEGHTALGVLAEGDHFGEQIVAGPDGSWDFTVTAVTAGTLLALPRADFQSLAEQSAGLRAQLRRYLESTRKPQNKHGEAHIDTAAGHVGEPDLPGTFVDYQAEPREYELSVAQTVLRVHTRVADLYNSPMNQVEQQLRLTIEALRERQEHEMINNAEIGLLHNVDHTQRIHAHQGPPTPDDFDELFSRRRNTRLFLAHPRAIAAFGRECNRRGIYPGGVEVQGHMVPAWRGTPILPCNKIPITDRHTTSVLALRTGEDDQGVIGLHQTGIPEEYQPSLSVRFMGISEKAIISYLVSAYYSVAVLVPDALGVLENVEISRPRD